MMNEQCTTLIIEDSAVELLKANDRLQRELFERERAERAARVSQALLSSIIDGTTDQIAALDLKLRFIAFNKAYKAEFLKIFGREIEIGVSLIDALAHLPQEQAKVVDLWSRALTGEEFTVIQERSGNTRERNYYKIKYNCIRDENNQIIGASLVIRDSSDRLGTEAALLKSEERLQLALLSSGDGLWEDKLKLLNAQLEESNQELQNFAFIASHDLNKNEISAELLERSLRYAIKQKQTEFALRLQAQRERLIQQVTQHIRSSLNQDKILSTTVVEVQQLLQADRVLIYRIHPDGIGKVIAESVVSGPTLLHQTIASEIFPQCCLFAPQGFVRTITDIKPEETSCDLTVLIKLFRSEIQHGSSSAFGFRDEN